MCWGRESCINGYTQGNQGCVCRIPGTFSTCSSVDFTSLYLFGRVKSHTCILSLGWYISLTVTVIPSLQSNLHFAIMEHPAASNTSRFTSILALALHSAVAWPFNIVLLGVPFYLRSQGLAVRRQAGQCKGAYDQWVKRQTVMVDKAIHPHRHPVPDSVMTLARMWSTYVEHRAAEWIYLFLPISLAFVGQVLRVFLQRLEHLSIAAAARQPSSSSQAQTMTLLRMHSPHLQHSVRYRGSSTPYSSMCMFDKESRM